MQNRRFNRPLIRRTMPIFETGNPNGTEYLFLLAGFPDDQCSTWGELLSKIRDSPNFQNHRMICMCLPDMQATPLRKPWGYTIPDILKIMRTTIDFYAPPNEKINIIVHDWGCMFGLLFCNENPKRIGKLAMFDVGVGISGAGKMPNLIAAVICCLYQWWWAIAFVISQLVDIEYGDIAFKLYFLLVPSFLQPAPYEVGHLKLTNISSHKCYIYFQFWKTLLLSWWTLVNLTVIPACPILYLVCMILTSYLFYSYHYRYHFIDR